MSDTTKVKPNGAWMTALSGNILSREKLELPIKRIPWTPGWVVVRQEQFEEGVVVLNEVEPTQESDGEPYELLLYSTSDEETGKIELNNGGTWPTGFVVIFE